MLLFGILISGNKDILSQSISQNNPDSIETSDAFPPVPSALSVDSLSYDSTQQRNLLFHFKDLFLDKVSVNNHGQAPAKSVKTKIPINDYTDYQGRIIRKIEYRQLEIFGQVVDDTTVVTSRWIDKLGNGLHISTQQHVLKNQSVIKTGDPLDLYNLSENERLLRELPFVSDAKAIIRLAGSDSVDILFITKDVLSLGFGLELLDIDYGKASLFNKNMLGLGHELDYDLTWNYNRNPFYGHKFRYRILNIGNTFFSLDATYENQWNIEAFRFYLNRTFYSQSTRYAGGVGFEKIYSLKNIYYPDSVQKDVKVDYNLYDMWLGRAILINRQGYSRMRSNIAITGRVTRYEFFHRPDVNESWLHDYWERTTCLAAIGFSRQGYIKSRLIYSYGKVEDLPIGTSFSFTGGLELNEFHNRPYAGINFSNGNNMKKFGYLYKQVAFGTFLNKGIEQGLLQVKADYFTDLINKTGRYKYRIFFDGIYKAGYKRFADEYVEFTKSDGIRGLSSDTLRGNQRLNFTLESVCYSPHYLMGFRFLYYLFLDIGLIGNESAILINNQLYSGIGAGIRIRNENLVFDAIQLRFAYYPVLPANASPDYFFLTTSGDRKFTNFIVPKPEVSSY
jgi:hypothetical protein